MFLQDMVVLNFGEYMPYGCLHQSGIDARKFPMGNGCLIIWIIMILESLIIMIEFILIPLVILDPFQSAYASICYDSNFMLLGFQFYAPSIKYK